MLQKDKNLRELLKTLRKDKLYSKANKFNEFVRVNNQAGTNHYFREIVSPQDRVTLVHDKLKGETVKMLMFGSNNYLNLANHPKILEAVKKDSIKYGLGIGGPPMLNGYTTLHRHLEERLSDIKGTESTMIYSSGFGANLAIPQTLCSNRDTFIYDEFSHASLIDGMIKTPAATKRFRHNDVEDLEAKVRLKKAESRDLFIGVEGIYSMDGDSSPLDKIVEVSKKHGAILILDDAHGLGTTGVKGHGTAECFDVKGDVDITMGTFSKSLAMAGGFISGSEAIINYMKFFARPYIFSAALPTICISAVLEGLNIIENEPERKAQLLSNVKYAARVLGDLDIVAEPEAAIISIRVPLHVNIRDLNLAVHSRGIFLNSIEYPAVPVEEQRLRISIMTNHTKKDIDYLANTLLDLMS